MKIATLIFLCCSALLTACDNSSDVDKKAKLLDKTSSLASNVANKAKDIGTNVGDNLDRAIETTEDAADNAVANVKESAVKVVDSAKKSVTDVVDGAMKKSKDISSVVVEKSEAAITSASASVTAMAINKEAEAIYKQSCHACHGAGVAGSPKLGDKPAWRARIAQGNAILLEHAIKGFKGAQGYMPPKGGAMNLSDDEIAMVVEYMVSKAVSKAK